MTRVLEATAMRTINVVAIFFVAQLCPISAQDSKPGKPDEKEIARLVQQLGDEDEKLQEKAALALIKIGTPALAELKKAAKNKNSDINGRANTLVRVLEPREGQAWCAYTGMWGQGFSG